MTENEHLLVCLMEEAQELAHACSKALRFGLGHKPKGKPLPNRLLIMLEYADLRGALELLQDRGVLPTPAYAVEQAAVRAKKTKILRNLKLAKKLRTVA